MPVHAFPADMRILIIEDAELDYLITEAQLKKALPEQFELIWATSYQQGLELLLSLQPTVALVDYFLHEDNGVDLIREARAKGSRVPLILLTAKEDYKTDLEAMAAGADEFLVKRHLDPALLERMLRYVLRVHTQREEIVALNQQLEHRVNSRTAELIGANYALQESERRMELLKQVASFANSADTVDEAFRQTMACVSAYTGWPVGHVALVRPASENPRLFATDIFFSVDSELYEPLRKATLEHGMFPQSSNLARIMQTLQPEWMALQDLPTEIYPRTPVALACWLQGLLAFPVMVKGRAMAVIEFFSTEVEQTTDELLQLMAEVSQQLGYVVERKQAEEALRTTQRRLTQAQHIARLGSFVLNPEAGVLNCSPEMVHMLQLKTDCLDIHELLAMIHSEDIERSQPADLSSPLAWSALKLDQRFQLANGQLMDIHIQTEAETDATGQLARIVGVVQDISERKRIEEVLVRMREAAEAANQAKSAFLASMSHEIRTPMNAILGFAQILLRDTQISNTQRQHLTTILRSGEHLLGLINDILEVSKIESGRINLNPNPFDLAQLLQDVEAMFTEKIQARRLRLSFEVARDVPPYLCTDEGKLRQVLINLLSNAVKFTEQGGIIVRVKCSPHSDANQLRLEWEVEDSGCGIAADELHKVFASFEQTASGLRSQSGTGLGMTISRSYVNLMGGSLDLRSELGVGTCFSFNLPVERVSAEAVNLRVHPRRVKGLAPGTQSPRLLLVDDRDTNLELLTYMLQPLGFSLQTALNGQEAVEGFLQWKPDAILMDAAMPIMDGLEATRRIRALPGGADVVILSISASAFEHDRASILASGATDFLAKPVREQDLLICLQQHLQLDLVYEEASETDAARPAAGSGDAAAAAIVDVVMIDLPLLTQMQEALLSGDLDHLAELTDELSLAQPELAAKLRQWAETFAYDQLNLLLQGALA